MLDVIIFLVQAVAVVTATVVGTVFAAAVFGPFIRVANALIIQGINQGLSKGGK